MIASWYLVIVAIGAARPTLTLAAFGALLVLAGAIGAGAQALRSRRLSYGLRRSDVAVTTMASPWYLLTGFLLSVPGLIAGGVAAAVIWGLGASRAPLLPVVGVAVAVMVLLAWWTPSSQTARYGMRSVLVRLAPDAKAARIWAGVGLLVAVAVALVLLGAGALPHWDPAPEPPIPSF